MKSKVILKWTKWFYRALLVLVMVLMSIGPWCYYNHIEQGGIVEVIRDYNNTGDFSELQLELCLLAYAIGLILLGLSFIKPKRFKFFTVTLAISILLVVAYVGILVGLPIWREAYEMSGLWTWMIVVTVAVLVTTIIGMICEKKAITKNEPINNEVEEGKSKVWIIYAVAVFVMIFVSIVVVNDKGWKLDGDTLYIEKEIRIWMDNEPLWGDEEFEELCVKRGVKEVHYMGLENNDDLEEVVLPKSVEYIGDNAFYGCKNLSEIEIPDSVEYIGYNAFEKCTSLKEIEIPEGMKYVFGGAFSECANLEYVKLPSTLEEVDYEAFYNCGSLRDIELPDSLERIDSYAFAGCYSLWSIYIPESVESIGNKAFHENTTLIVEFGSYAEQWAIENGYTYEIY